MTSKIKEVFWPKSATKIYDFCKSCKQLRDTAVAKCKFNCEPKKSYQKNIQKKIRQDGLNSILRLILCLFFYRLYILFTNIIIYCWIFTKLNN